MFPPFPPYLPINHPDDLLPIQPTRRAPSSEDVWAKWLAEDYQAKSQPQILSMKDRFFQPARRIPISPR